MSFASSCDCTVAVIIPPFVIGHHHQALLQQLIEVLLQGRVHQWGWKRQRPHSQSRSHSKHFPPAWQGGYSFVSLRVVNFLHVHRYLSETFPFHWLLSPKPVWDLRMLSPGIGHASPDAFSCRIRSAGGRFRKKFTSKRGRSSVMPDICSRKT